VIARVVPARLFAEWLGTALLVASVVGSGIMAERLAGDNDALALLANTMATVCALFVLIEILAPVSGAHFNPAVTLILALRREFPWRLCLPYCAVQVAGAVCGALLANGMFGLSVLQFSGHGRSGAGQWLGEVVATMGLVLVVLRGNPRHVPFLVAAWIGAAYWFTSSTSFANPAVTLGRMFSDSFAGIHPGSAPPFIAAQLAGALLGWQISRLLDVRES
jgi:glycerol uptake facilitator-like aquaporin